MDCQLIQMITSLFSTDRSPAFTAAILENQHSNVGLEQSDSARVNLSGALHDSQHKVWRTTRILPQVVIHTTLIKKYKPRKYCSPVNSSENIYLNFRRQTSPEIEQNVYYGRQRIYFTVS
jgi:hypothetical protein